MEKNFEARRKGWLEKIELEYYPPPAKSIWSKPVPVYKELWEYSRKYNGPDITEERIVVRQNRQWLVFPTLMIVVFGSQLIESPEANWLKCLLNLSGFFLIMWFVKWTKKIPGRKSLLTLDRTGIMLMDENFLVKWEHILRIDVKEISDSESTTQFIVIQAYDEAYDYFRPIAIDPSVLTTNLETLSFYIEHFKNRR
ncbi:MAG: hypothetical protein V4722_14350 [Bacteroidota bacterium]